jgi:NAD(P)-dependent dehydrogenase (short-subunit alcohol dehydrogenase family)
VVALGRRTVPAIDFDNEASIAQAALALKAQGPFHLIINATGVLHGGQGGQSEKREHGDLQTLPQTPPATGSVQGMPEKRMASLQYAHMEAIFRINTMGPALVMAHFAPLLDKQRGVLAVLSAKVGSIGDNRLGGWYSYRASKAALNMLLKTAAIEVQRTDPQVVLVALHPGTVDSALSAPFKGAEIGRPASDAAADMLRVLDGLTPAQSGGFYAYTGQELPW